VKHTAGEYVRYELDGVVHTNTVENVFSVLKRGMKGVYEHCGEAHLHRYLNEFAFRYNNRSALGIEDAADGECDQRRSRKAPDLPSISSSRARLDKW
jgi:hypothetical protein